MNRRGIREHHRVADMYPDESTRDTMPLKRPSIDSPDGHERGLRQCSCAHNTARSGSLPNNTSRDRRIRIGRHGCCKCRSLPRRHFIQREVNRFNVRCRSRRNSYRCRQSQPSDGQVSAGVHGRNRAVRLHNHTRQHGAWRRREHRPISRYNLRLYRSQQRCR